MASSQTPNPAPRRLLGGTLGSLATLALLGASAPPLGAQQVADSATPPSVEAAPLGAPGPGGAGLLSPAVTGLPVTLWQGTDPATLRDLIAATRPAVPALRDLMHALMLAEAAPPAEGTDGVAHLVARIDWLTDMGAVDEALALVEITGHDRPALFARWAELSLLLGRTDAPCNALRRAPGLSRDLSLRIFCTARAGDWSRAALLLASARTLGDLPARRVDLLERFLDPELMEEGGELLPPVRPSALEFRLFEALGEPLPTAPLPLAFSVLDLAGDNGWRAQVAAAERLARTGALPANRLLGLYSLREPAASGGIWDRIDALQGFETALNARDPDALGAALDRVWPQMASAGLLVPFAELFGERLSRENLSGRAAQKASRAALLAPQFETLLARLPDDAEHAFLAAIARGDPPAPQAALPDLPHAAAVARGFAEPEIPVALRDQLRQGRLGEVILRAFALFGSGAAGNGGDLTDALGVLRAVGLEEVARRSALQLMLLDAERARR